MQEGEIEMHRKILIIGAGGIGSHLIPFLSKIGLYDITVYDDDKVEEKNLTYQNFNDEDIGNVKVNCFEFMVTPQPYQVLVEGQLQGYDLVICCADNLAVRRLLYRQGYGDSAKIKWLDLRAQGRNAALISYKVDENLVDALLAGPDGSFSCQGEDWDGSPEEINTMHICIAGAATQWIQRWFNDNDNVTDKVVWNI
jgi:hypothetical protein